MGARAEARAAAEMVGEMVEVRVGAKGVERVGVERVGAAVGAMVAETGAGVVEGRGAAARAEAAVVAAAGGAGGAEAGAAGGASSWCALPSSSTHA